MTSGYNASTQLRVPERLGLRCKLGAVMWNYLAMTYWIEEARKVIAANVVREVVDVDGKKWIEVRELEFGVTK